MKILFVCTGNAYRSPVAEALLKHLNPNVEVDSAGLSPAIPISRDAIKYLSLENAQDHLKAEPESLSQKNLQDYDIIVAMENRHREAVASRCPQCREKIVVWNISDPYFLPQEYTEKIFNEIKTKVQKLNESLLEQV
jgi:protein-tyrosine-phosphatase